MTPISENLLKQQGWTRLNTNWMKDKKTLFAYNGHWRVNGINIKYMEQIDNQNLIDRKYMPSFAELCDRLSIIIQKIVHSPNEQLKSAFQKEAQDIKHDINKFIEEGVKVDAHMIEGFMLLQLVNRDIWVNESAARGDGDGAELIKTHRLNSDRNTAKKRISELCKGRIDEKLDYHTGLYNYEFK